MLPQGLQIIMILKLIQLMTPRNISICKAGDCLYLPIIDQNAGLINDPVLLKHSEEKFWLSIADSDLLLFAIGLSIGLKLDVVVSEADIWTVSIQGPKAEDLISDLFGEQTRNIKFFKFDKIDFKKTKQIIARSGYSRQGGFEIYLEGKVLGPDLWDLILQAGQKYNIRPGAPNLIDRIEAGLISFGNDMTSENTPLECGMEKYCSLTDNIDFLGKEYLIEEKRTGSRRQIRGVIFSGESQGACTVPWQLYDGSKSVGQITSGIFNPSLRVNTGIALIEKGHWNLGQRVDVVIGKGDIRRGQVCFLPFTTPENREILMSL